LILGIERLSLVPRIKLEDKYQLDAALQAMGLTVAYSQDADFSGITGDKSLSVQTAVHKTYGDISEKGTEAAAATGIGIGTSAIEEGQVVTLDHPFLFFIRDTKSGEVLFLGRCADPSAQ
jgi:serpin B